jgi:hypothetical protein
VIEGLTEETRREEGEAKTNLILLKPVEHNLVEEGRREK